MFAYKLKELLEDKISIKVSGTVRSDESLDKLDEMIQDIYVQVDTKKLTRVVLDFSSLRLINSSGIGKLLLLNRNLSGRKAKLILVGLAPALLQIFRFARIEDVITIRDRE